MSIYDPSLAEIGCSREEQLYRTLISPEYFTDNYCREELGENMEVVSTLFIDEWKPRFLLDHRAKCAYEFMNENARLVGVAESDIDWISLQHIPQECLSRVKCRNAMFPTFIRRYENKVAEVRWQLNPNGRYWMDEDGFGMIHSEECNIYGYIDRSGKIIVPYQAITDYTQLRDMRMRAEIAAC